MIDLTVCEADATASDGSTLIASRNLLLLVFTTPGTTAVSLSAPGALSPSPVLSSRIGCNTEGLTLGVLLVIVELSELGDPPEELDDPDELVLSSTNSI